MFIPFETPFLLPNISANMIPCDNKVDLNLQHCTPFITPGILSKPLKLQPNIKPFISFALPLKAVLNAL